MQIIACILIADFLTGVVHWFEDTYGLPSWPWLGASVIEPNIRHHEHPVEFTMRSVIYRNYQVFLSALGAIAIAWLTGWLGWQIALTIALASLGNEVHAWSHKRPRWWIVRLLQDMKLLISPEQHAKHHRRPYDTNFCTLTNVLNPLLDGLRVWRGLEALLSLVGWRVRRMSAERRGF